MNGDQIRLTLPRERPFFGIAHLVVGGLAVRLDLSYEELEDLQVALSEVIGQREDHRALTLAVSVAEQEFVAAVGPVDDSLVEELRRAPGDTVGSRRVLDTVVDDVEIVERDGSPWVSLRKSIQRAGATS
jgi:hypothetical protein